MPRIVGLDHRGLPRGVGTPRVEVKGELHQRGPRLAIHGKQLGHHSGFGRVGCHTRRVARPVRAQTVAVGRIGPRQERAGAQLGKPTAAHSLGDQRALILSYGAPDLQQQMVVRVVAHGPVQELGCAAGTSPFLQEHHLVDVVARQAVGRRDQHAVDLAALDGVAQAVEPWAHQRGTAVAVVAEHMGGVEGPALGGMRADMGDKARELLFNGLVLDLMAGRNAAVDRYAHGVPPAGSGAPAPRPARAEWPSIAGGAGRPGPSAAGRWSSPCPCAGHATCAAACSPPQ